MAEETPNLRFDGEASDEEIEAPLHAPLWAVGGGKAVVGKSVTSLNLSMYLAMMGRRVVVIDGDLGGADMHTLLGMPPPKLSLASFLDRDVESLEDTLVETVVPRLRLLASRQSCLGCGSWRRDSRASVAAPGWGLRHRWYR